MRRLPEVCLLGALIATIVLPGPVAAAAEPGGASAPATQLSAASGGSQYGVRAASLRPVVTSFSAPSSAVEGRPPRVTFRIDESGVGTVNVLAVVHDLSTRQLATSAKMGWVHTGRVIAVVWPRGATLTAGTYHVSLIVRDHHGGSLLRTARASGVATMTVKAPAATPPAPIPQLPEAGVPTPVQTAAMGAVFPVRGAHSFGDAANRFGAPRGNHTHQGQDVLTAEGTQIAAPLGGTIVTTSNQVGGAGYYLVEHTSVGFDFMFAHCEANSFAVSKGQAITGGQALCLAGQTGDANAPHLHFEMWVGGWQAAGGHPIDPLPYLEAW